MTSHNPKKEEVDFCLSKVIYFGNGELRTWHYHLVFAFFNYNVLIKDIEMTPKSHSSQQKAKSLSSLCSKTEISLGAVYSSFEFTCFMSSF